MPTAHQKYSTRIHSRRQLGRVNEHLAEISRVLSEVGQRYHEALPQVSKGCGEMVYMVDLLQNLVEDIRTNI